jgi:hypothetical protein
MAIVGNSYLYHMRNDLVENIQPGVAQVPITIYRNIQCADLLLQHFGDNTLALLTHLSSSISPLPELADGGEAPTSVYFSYLGGFMMYSARTAVALYSMLLLIVLAFVRLSGGTLEEVGRGARAVVVGVVGAAVGANIAAVVMERVLGKTMSWFTHEYACLGLYGGPALTGALCCLLVYHAR